MPFFSRSETCPFCFEPFRLSDTPFRCTSPSERCPPEVDAERAKFWDDSSPIGRVLSPVGFSSKEIRCRTCSQLSRQRLCLIATRSCRGPSANSAT